MEPHQPVRVSEYGNYALSPDERRYLLKPEITQLIYAFAKAFRQAGGRIDNENFKDLSCLEDDPRRRTQALVELLSQRSGVDPKLIKAVFLKNIEDALGLTTHVGEETENLEFREPPFKERREIARRVRAEVVKHICKLAELNPIVLSERTTTVSQRNQKLYEYLAKKRIRQLIANGEISSVPKDGAAPPGFVQEFAWYVMRPSKTGSAMILRMLGAGPGIMDLQETFAEWQLARGNSPLIDSTRSAS